MTATASGSDDGGRATTANEGEDGARRGGDEDAEVSGREIDRRPVPLSSVLAIAASAVVAIAAGTGNTAGGALAAVGVAILAGAVVAGSRRLVDVAGLTLLFGVVLAGSGDPGEFWILLAAASTVLAWDVAQNAISLGEQLGRDADTAPAELVHAAATVTVAASTTGVAFVLYRFAGSNQPLGAVVLLLVAAAILLGAIR